MGNGDMKMMYYCDRGPLPYTDLACERRRADESVEGVEYERERLGELTWERIKITSDIGAKSIGRPKGLYHTLGSERIDLVDGATLRQETDEIAKELRSIAERSNAKQNRVLVVGLGNRNLTSDALGCLTCDKVKPTRHIKKYDGALFGSLECSEISVITPGVTAKTGLDSVETVASVCRTLSPTLVVAIDSIATSSYERLGATVQITNAGICPGSGLYSVRSALNEATLGAPVIAVGVPTVIDARMLYLDGLGEVNPPDMSKIPSPSMFVSPKEIDEIVNCYSQIIANSINLAFGIYQ
ncbi:MAG: GPR endopeptidase [Clostridia bacterium]|nr:GPR endopeptidase [Clostridia bacterium]